MSAVRVRLFAGAAESVGASELEVPAETLGALVEALAAASDDPDVRRVLARCSFLADGARLDGPDARVPAGARIDVLPPFAGG